MLPSIDNECIRAIFGFNDFVREFGRSVKLNLARSREVEFEDFLGDHAGAVEGVVEPKVGGKGMVRGSDDDTIFEDVTGFEPEDTDGFDVDVLVGGGVDDGGIGIVG